MLAGGSTERMTPVYYKYGLPGSYDENWGFELMWDPMADLRSGRARTLYDYNLGCNVPVYLHIDLRKDNEHCVVLWWYASTCRHLGIGGTHANPAVVRAQQDAMRRYRELERFYKRGEFFGINEEIHVHVLPEEQAMVVNLFNLSDQAREISGSIPLADLGLEQSRSFPRQRAMGHGPGRRASCETQDAAWSAAVASLQARQCSWSRGSVMIPRLFLQETRNRPLPPLHYRCDSRDSGREIGLWRRDRINGSCGSLARCWRSARPAS